MTDREIKDLFASGPLCCGPHEAGVARLLEERKRLLKACRALERFAVATDAIAYAEAPATEGRPAAGEGKR